MMDKILVLTRPEDVEEINRVVKPYCKKIEIASCDISGHKGMNKRYDLIVSYSYAPIIKEEFIESCGCPIINVHPTLLPYGRGIYPLLWACINDEPFGATIHMIESNEMCDSFYVTTATETYVVLLNSVKNSFITDLLYSTVYFY